jgi:Protein of unknown function (DUF3551)
MVKHLAMGLAYLTLLFLSADRAVAQYRPWCLITPGLTVTCIYYTFEQCLASRIGSSTYCAQNPDAGEPAGTSTTKGRRR